MSEKKIGKRGKGKAKTDAQCLFYDNVALKD
jgi:hypothetical protein